MCRSLTPLVPILMHTASRDSYPYCTCNLVICVDDCYFSYTHANPRIHSYTHTFLIQNSRSALHLAAYRGHLPVLQYLCPMFGDRVLDRDGNDETCLDIARRLGRESIVEYLTQNYPQLEGKVGFKQGWHNERLLRLLKSVGHKCVNVCSWDFCKARAAL